MNTYTFHITPYDVAFLGTIFIGLGLALQLWFVKRINQTANRFFGLALAIVVLWIAWMLGVDVRLSSYFPRWSWLPLQFSLALGPLIYFYVLKLTRPEYKLRLKDLLHFSPLWLQQGVLVFEIRESISSGAATYDTLTFQQLNPVLQLLSFISVVTYLYWSFRLIERFYQREKFNDVSDRYRYELRWLSSLLTGFGLLWLLWIPFTAVDYFYYHSRLGIHAYYPLYLLLTIMMIRIAVQALFRPEAGMATQAPPVFKPTLPAELKQKGIWLKKVVKTNLYYQDPELSLVSLAEKLELTTHELSRIINTVLKKSFNDFINEYRVADVVQKMQDPSYDHLTLLGIAFESGFNSKTTFHRIFKQVTGKSPAEYKTEGKKGIPSYNLELYSRMAPVISYQQIAPNWTGTKLNLNYMFSNYLKTAWRHITRHKMYTAINVMGLALGICGCLVIYLITSFEFSFDTFHPDKERIYCIDASVAGNPDPDQAHWNSVPAPMPDAMRNEMSGLEKVAAFQLYNPKVKIKEGGKVIKAFDWTEGIIADASYFDILPYTWLSGSKKTSLNNPMTVVLTQSRAKTYFGDLQPDEMIGKTITYDDSLTVTVTGILKDWNKNSDFNFSDFISFSTINSSFLKHQIALDNWQIVSHGSQELVKLPVSINPAQIDKQFPSFIKKYIDPDPHTKLHIQLQPFTGIHFHREYGGEGRKADLRILYILSAVAIFILFIAAVNFINLSTAQSIQRTKEIGIRKVLGSGKSAILFQFLTETFTLALLAVAIAVIAVKPVLNLFAAYIPRGVKFDFTKYTTWIFLICVAVFTTLLAGLYPARQLSVFKPVASLKGEINEKMGNKGYLRKSLIVFQFTISLIFIIGTIGIGRQISYMQNQELGFKTSNIITLRSLWNDQTGKMKVLAQKVKQLPGVDQVITEAFPPMGFAHNGNGIKLQGRNNDFINASIHSGNEDFVPFYNMKIVAGRNLLHSDSAREYLLNETAVRALGFNNPEKAIGKLLLFGGQNKAYPIAGVVADFYENSFHQQIMPVVIANDPQIQKGIALKLTPAEFQKGDIPKLVNGIAKEWKKIYPEEPFDYSFLGDSIARLYESDQQTQWLMRTATLITIFISCMGLFGLAMFTTERRTKEISIRKVLGASVTNILTMLNKEVVVLIAISLLISSPIAWFFIHKWLQNFAYHTNLSFWIFILAGAGAMLIALLTISFRTMRSAMANPVTGLRDE
ncbi:ABC transporter permease [Mucilaginibacter sp. OK098]|uniref:ABC transporter permease n=1 Tax=Mucilaginibacter sp. OK098 TaxID=1855297 RepID=UPI0009136AA5|nr:ABC transporter permease [Mucilaginibacter sp. OK098]SHN31870.1 ABC-type antimicrobial peptide transport system, permease component [Mucilaginibacter sp. OK098]